MKILVFSDSHTDIETMIKVEKREKADIICHLGDHITDALELEKQVDIPVYYVAGNTDTVEPDLYKKYITIFNKRFLLTHGTEIYHKEIIKCFDELSLYDSADIILFGHTHEPFINGFMYDEGHNYFTKKWLFNPGSIRPKWHGYATTSTYGIIHLSENTDDIRFEIVEI